MHQRLWYYKDDLYKKNHLNHTHHLPSWFWETDDIPIDMHCVSHVLKKVENTGYSHHIERLMIIGNFCMLVGYDPHEVNRRFWEQYADAFERVVSPNVLGMSQYADGGKLATKPYISSANYVNKMSNYCSSCVYDPKEKYGENACPLNYLYRKFVNANQETLKQ
jgi:deoxyribodipyrimidine photolyase-related protein